ncbi:hypothetical protein T4C_2877, partial [Trichinella pseudospiralis]
LSSMEAYGVALALKIPTDTVWLPSLLFHWSKY